MMDLDLSKIESLDQLGLFELVLIDFQVFMYCGRIEHKEDSVFEVMSRTGCILYYPDIMEMVFLKNQIADHEYNLMVERWNLTSLTKAK